MGDEGIAALAHLIHQGRLEKLEYLCLSHNHAVTDQGAKSLVQAIDTLGLPNLKFFHMMSIVELKAVGISAITQTLTKGCPQLIESDLNQFGPEEGQGI